MEQWLVVIPPPEDWLDDEHLIEAVRTLTERERAVLYLRMVKRLSQVEVANELDLHTPAPGSNTQVSRAEASAFKKLKILLLKNTNQKSEESVTLLRG